MKKRRRRRKSKSRAAILMLLDRKHPNEGIKRWKCPKAGCTFILPTFYTETCSSEGTTFDKKHLRHCPFDKVPMIPCSADEYAARTTEH